MKARKPGWFDSVSAIRIDTPRTVTMPAFVSIELWSEIQEMGASQAFDFVAEEMLRVGADGRRTDANKAVVQATLADLAKGIGKSLYFQRCKKRFAKRAK